MMKNENEPTRSWAEKLAASVAVFGNVAAEATYLRDQLVSVITF